MTLDEAFKVLEKYCAENWVAVSLTIRPKKADAGKAWPDSKFSAHLTHGGQGAYGMPPVYASDPVEALKKAVGDAFKIDEIKP